MRINSAEENIWAYDDFGVRFGADTALPQPRLNSGSEDEDSVISEEDGDDLEAEEDL